MSNTSLAQERATKNEARKRMFFILKEAEERYRHELMDTEERLMLHDRIVRLKTRLAKVLRATLAGLLFCSPAIRTRDVLA